MPVPVPVLLLLSPNIPFFPSYITPGVGPNPRLQSRNVHHLMSDLLVTPNTATLLPVRSLDDLRSSYESTASPTRPAAITIASPSRENRADTLSQSCTNISTCETGYGKAEEGNGVQSSVVNGAASTPRQGPSRNGSDHAFEDDSFISQNLSSIHHSPNAPSPPVPLWSFGLGQERTRPSPWSIAATLGRTVSANPQPSSPSHLRKSFEANRVASASVVENHKNTAALFGRHLLRPSLGQRTRSQGSTTVAPMSGVEDPVAKKNNNRVQAEQSSSELRRETFPREERNRSSSRGNGRVEKRIEATLPQAEQPSNARSRKSSHVLGLFKENTSSQNSKKAQDKVKTDLASSRDRSTQRAENVTPTGPEYERVHPRPAEQLLEDHVKSSHHLSTAGSDHPKDQRANIERDEITQPQGWKSSTGTGSSIPHPLDNEAVRWETRDEKLAPSVREGAYGEKSGGERNESEAGTSSHRPGELISSEDSLVVDPCTCCPQELGTEPELRVGEEARTSALESPQDSSRLGVGEAEAGDEEESDKEQISSALYYPHQVPSPHSPEDSNISPEGDGKDSGKIGKSQLAPLPPPALPIDAPSEDVDIALQSYNKSRYLHGDLQKAWMPPSGDANDRVAVAGASSVSGSEYGEEDETASSTNGEDSSHTNEPETTPTATPVPKGAFPSARDRKKHHAAAAPIRAVELKPYNHQVGGHSTVFRFSRRAVCKQLSNRENEFYEVVEREHPELLRFLPRYASRFPIHDPLR